MLLPSKKRPPPSAGGGGPGSKRSAAQHRHVPNAEAGYGMSGRPRPGKHPRTLPRLHSTGLHKVAVFDMDQTFVGDVSQELLTHIIRRQTWSGWTPPDVKLVDHLRPGAGLLRPGFKEFVEYLVRNDYVIVVYTASSYSWAHEMVRAVETALDLPYAFPHALFTQKDTELRTTAWKTTPGCWRTPKNLTYMMCMLKEFYGVTTDISHVMFFDDRADAVQDCKPTDVLVPEHCRVREAESAAEVARQVIIPVYSYETEDADKGLIDEVILGTGECGIINNRTNLDSILSMTRGNPFHRYSKHDVTAALKRYQEWWDHAPKDKGARPEGWMRRLLSIINCLNMLRGKGAPGASCSFRDGSTIVSVVEIKMTTKTARHKEVKNEFARCDRVFYTLLDRIRETGFDTLCTEECIPEVGQLVFDDHVHAMDMYARGIRSYLGAEFNDAVDTYIVQVKRGSGFKAGFKYGRYPAAARLQHSIDTAHLVKDDPVLVHTSTFASVSVPLPNCSTNLVSFMRHLEEEYTGGSTTWGSVSADVQLYVLNGAVGVHKSSGPVTITDTTNQHILGDDRCYGTRDGSFVVTVDDRVSVTLSTDPNDAATAHLNVSASCGCSRDCDCGGDCGGACGCSKCNC